MATKQLGLSTSALNIFRDCPRCFWLEKVKNIKRPQGIRASLPLAIDKVMKEHQEFLEFNEMPCFWLDPRTIYIDRTKLERYRSWRTFQVPFSIGGIEGKIWGEIDEVIQDQQGVCTPLDYKSKGTEPDQEYGEKYCQHQLDYYHLLLEGHGEKCSGEGVLRYGWPIAITDNDRMKWGFKNIILKTNPDDAYALVTAAVECIKGEEPRESMNCEYCAFVGLRS